MLSIPDQGPLKVPTGCLLSGLNLMTSQCPLWQLDMASDIIIQGHFIDLAELKLKVYTVVGAHDDLEVTFNNMGFTTKIYVKTSYFQTGVACKR